MLDPFEVPAEIKGPATFALWTFALWRGTERQFHAARGRPDYDKDGNIFKVHASNYLGILPKYTHMAGEAALS